MILEPLKIKSVNVPITQDWETGSWRAQQNIVHKDPGERNSDTTGYCPGLNCGCLGVSCEGMGQWWPAAGLGAWTVAGHAWTLLRKFAIIFITSIIVWPQVNSREGKSSTHQQKVGFTEHGPSELDPFPPSVMLSHKEAFISSYPSPSEDRQTENHNHRKLTNLITWTTALSSSMKV